MTGEEFDSDFTRNSILREAAEGIMQGMWVARSIDDNGDRIFNKELSGILNAIEVDAELNSLFFSDKKTLGSEEPELDDYADAIGELYASNTDNIGLARTLARIRELFGSDKHDGLGVQLLNRKLRALELIIEYEFRIMNDMEITLNEEERKLKPDLCNNKLSNNQIFLSYQMIDWVYTIGLYNMFKKRGWFLYVDWMHNGRLGNGKAIKNVLNPEIMGSSKFVSLPHHRLMHNLRVYTTNITTWCAWEIGARFACAQARSEPKYLISTNIELSLPDMYDSFEIVTKVSDITS